MACNKMFRAYCEIMTDHYGGCETHVCLVELLGEEMLLEKCEHCGLDKEYPLEYVELKNKIKGNEGNINE